jgi:hypothetical protein
VVAAGTAVLGTFNAIAATVRLPPAEAMRAPSPARFRRTVLERLGLQRLPMGLRMILRNVERRPWRSALATAGVAGGRDRSGRGRGGTHRWSAMVGSCGVAILRLTALPARVTNQFDRVLIDEAAGRGIPAIA